MTLSTKHHVTFPLYIVCFYVQVKLCTIIDTRALKRPTVYDKGPLGDGARKVCTIINAKRGTKYKAKINAISTLSNLIADLVPLYHMVYTCRM